MNSGTMPAFSFCGVDRLFRTLAHKSRCGACRSSLSCLSGELLFQGIATVYIINSTSLRQACVPQELRGRTAAVVRVLSGGVGSFGALPGMMSSLG